MLSTAQTPALKTKDMDSEDIQKFLAKRSSEESTADESGNNSGNEGDIVSKRPRTQEEKKLDRILANRRSARRSRERRKQLQDNLEKSVILLTRQNEDLSRENDLLKQELRVLMNVFNEKRNMGSAPVNFTDNNLRQELLLRMATSTGGAGGLIPDRNSSYATTLASNLQQQPNRQLPELFLGGAGQQMFAHANAGLFTGQGSTGMRR